VGQWTAAKDYWTVFIELFLLTGLLFLAVLVLISAFGFFLVHLISVHQHSGAVGWVTGRAADLICHNSVSGSPQQYGGTKCNGGTAALTILRCWRPTYTHRTPGLCHVSLQQH